MRSLRAVARASSVALALAVAGACGGGGEDSPPPAAPGANVDPGAGGVVGGSINRAKDVADDAESRDQELEQQGGANGATSLP